MHQLELCLDYWPASGSGEVSIMRGAHYSRVPHKQVRVCLCVCVCVCVCLCLCLCLCVYMHVLMLGNSIIVIHCHDI